MRKALVAGLASGLLGLVASSPASALTTFTSSGQCNTPMLGSCNIVLDQDWGGANWTGSSFATLTVTHVINDTAFDDFYFLNGFGFGASSSAYPNEVPEPFNVSAIMATSGGLATFTVNSSDFDGFFNDCAFWQVTLTSNVPEPLTLGLLGLGLLGLGFSRRKRQA